MPELEDHEASRIAKAAAHVGEWTAGSSTAESPPPAPWPTSALLAAKHILAQVEAGIARHAAFLASRKTSSASS
jgi:hypothetical protein